jgi:hypothetical protein
MRTVNPDTATTRSEDVPAFLRPAMTAGMEAIAKSSTSAAVNDALRTWLRALYPPLAEDAERRGRLADLRDVTGGAGAMSIPVLACRYILDVVDSDAGLLPAELRQHVHRLLALLAGRLDPMHEPAPPLREGEPDAAVIACMLIYLDAEAEPFRRSYVIFRLPFRPPTKEQRAAARQARLAEFKARWAVSGYVVTDADVFRAAGVEVTGNGSGRDWKNGTLLDRAKTSRLIEEVIERNLLKPSQLRRRE